MSNFVMHIDFFGNSVRAETENKLVCLNDLLIAGNAWRVNVKLPPKRLVDILSTDGFKNFLESAERMSGAQPGELLKIVGKGRGARTMGGILVAIYVAEQLSTDFHVKVIQTFVESKILEFRQLGATEFRTLNAAIDQYLPGRDSKSNVGVFITVAKMLRSKILISSEDWNTATVSETNRRYEIEAKLADYLKMGLIADFKHLKLMIEKM